METLLNARSYFAVELYSEEEAHTLSYIVLLAAKETKVKFQRLESMDLLTVGSTDLLRFRSDAEYITPVLDALKAQGRAVVEPKGPTFLLRKNGRQGPVPPHRMLAVPCRTHRQAVYLGTAAEFWEEQFGSDPLVE